MIKVCGDPHCEAVYHEIPKEVTKCNDCGGTLKMINENTYQKKYANWYFQYIYPSMQYLHEQRPH